MKQRPDPDLTETRSQHPLDLIFEAGLAIEHLSQRLEAQVGISVTQWVILSRLRDCPACSAQLLATQVGIQPSTLTQALKRLEAKRHLFVGVDPLDRRKKILSITRGGNEALERAESFVGPWIQPSQVVWGRLSELKEQLIRMR